MLKMPLDQVLAKLKDKTGLSEEELSKKLQQKMDQLSGLISKEGAAHIVANELGVTLFEQISGKVKIKDLLEGMRDFEVVGKPVRIFETKQFTTADGREGQVCSFILGDDTATIRVAAWNAQADLLGKAKEKETIIKITGGYLKTNQGKVELHVNDRATVELDPKGIQVNLIEGAGAPSQQYPAAIRKPINDVKDGDENVELLGTIVQVFDPRFFEVCPQCQKRVRAKDGVFSCDSHLQVEPAYSFLVSFFLDDGTNNMRVTCFRNSATRLCNIQEQQFLKYREDPYSFDAIKTELLGQIVKVVGRAKKNDMFDRVEFTANLIFPEPDPKGELKK